MDNKPFWKSKTLWGVVITAVAFIARLVFKAEVPEDFQATATDQAIEAVTAVSILVGTILALFGRAKADTKLTAN